MTWTEISCADRDAAYAEDIADRIMGVISGRSDMSGEYGDPRVETIWGLGDSPILKDVRHPRYEWDGQIGDRLPCEHYEWSN